MQFFILLLFVCSVELHETYETTLRNQDNDNLNIFESQHLETAKDTKAQDHAKETTSSQTNYDEHGLFDDYALIEDHETTTTSGAIKYKRSASTVSASTVSAIYPEVYVVVDNALFTKLDRSERKTKEYVVTFMSAVNARFSALTGPTVDLSLAGIEIGRSSSATPYLTSNIVSGNLVEAEAALADLGQHYFNRRIAGSIYDLVLVLTGEDLCRMKGRKCSSSTAGYAYVGGACVTNPVLKKTNSVALVEDSAGFSGVIVAAHEIGHLLGAIHDGQAAPRYLHAPGSRSCSWKGGYIMSDARRTRNGLLWSPCSQAQISHFTRSQQASCLLNKPSSSNKHPLVGAALLSTRVQSLDEQCRAEAGTGSKACFTDSRVCTQLFCLNLTTGSCISYRPAVEGSVCSASGFCSNGLCKDKPKTTYYKPVIPARKTSGKKVIKKRPSKITNEISYKKPIPKVVKKVKDSSNDSEGCVDQPGIVGSGLTCGQLYQRYAFLYCAKPGLRVKCCVSFNKHC